MATAPAPDTEPTIGRLVTDVSRDVSTLISKEIALAKTELKVSVTNGAVGVGFFGAAAFLGVLAVIMLSVSIAYFINWNGDGLDLHWAFLIVFAGWLLLAGLLALLGLRKVKKVRGPERAIAQAQETKKALTNR